MPDERNIYLIHDFAKLSQKADKRTPEENELFDSLVEYHLKDYYPSNCDPGLELSKDKEFFVRRFIYDSLEGNITCKQPLVLDKEYPGYGLCYN